MLDDPIEVELFRRLAEAPAVLQHGGEDGSAGGHADAGADDHHRLVVDVELGGGGVRTVHSNDRVAVDTEPFFLRFCFSFFVFECLVVGM